MVVLRPLSAGPIPASAGEPPSWSVTCRLRRAYPRECGGTAAILGLVLAVAGLSPRVRGNRLISVTRA